MAGLSARIDRQDAMLETILERLTPALASHSSLCADTTLAPIVGAGMALMLVQPRAWPVGGSRLEDPDEGMISCIRCTGVDVR